MIPLSYFAYNSSMSRQLKALESGLCQCGPTVVIRNCSAMLVSYSMNSVSKCLGSRWLFNSQSLALPGSYVDTLMERSIPDYSGGPGAFMAMLAPTMAG